MKLVYCLIIATNLLSTKAYGFADVRFGGTLFLGSSSNPESLPAPEKDETSIVGGNFITDVLITEFILVLGARYTRGSSSTSDYFYYDTPDNQYTRYNMEHEYNSFSYIAGFRFADKEMELPSSYGNSKARYTASLLATLPFKSENHVRLEARNNTGTEITLGIPQTKEEWGVYFEGTMTSGMFTMGMQLGYYVRRLKDFEDENQTPVTDYNGNAFKLDLSGAEFLLFLGLQF